MDCASSFIKKLFKKPQVDRNKKLSIVYYYSLMQLYKQIKILIYTDLLNFTTKCSGCQMKAFSLLFFVPLVIQKV